MKKDETKANVSRAKHLDEGTEPKNSYTKEELDVLATRCKAVLENVLLFLNIDFALCTTEVSQAGSGKELHFACKWAFENRADSKMSSGIFFFTPGDEPEEAKQVIAMQVTLALNPMGAGYYMMASVVQRFSLPDQKRNNPAELMIRAVLTDIRNSGKIPYIQAGNALAQILHLQENIDEAYDMNPLQAAKVLDG